MGIVITDQGIRIYFCSQCGRGIHIATRHTSLGRHTSGIIVITGSLRLRRKRRILRRLQWLGSGSSQGHGFTDQLKYVGLRRPCILQGSIR